MVIPMKSTRLLLIIAATTLQLPIQAQTPAGTGMDELLALLNTPIRGASKREQRLIDSPQAIEVITGQDIQTMGSTTLIDVLRSSTSLDLIESGSGSVVIGLRGIMQDGQPRTVQILVDGVPLYSAFAGPIDLDTIPLPIAAIDRIEIVRGPSSTLYGANAVAGVVAITTRQGGDKFEGRASVASGSHRAFRGGLSVGTTLKPISIQASYQGYSRQETGRRSPVLGTPASEKTTNDTDAVHGAAGLVSLSAKLPNGALTFSAGRATKRTGTEYFTYIAPETTTLRAGWQTSWTPTFSTEFRASSVEKKSTLAPNAPYAAVFADSRFLGDYPFFSAKTQQIEVQGNWNPSEVFHVVFGADTRKLKAEGPVKFIGLRSTETEETASGGFLSADYAITKALTLSAGLRAENESLGGSRMSPRAAMVWKAAENRVFRFGYYTSTRSPQIMESRVDFLNPTGLVAMPPLPPLPVLFAIRPNQSLAPEKIANFEFGYRESLGPVMVDLSVYRMTIKDQIETQALAPVITSTSLTLVEQFQNTSDATNSGAELSLSVAAGHGFTYGANVAYLNYERETEKAPLGKGFAYAPKTKASLWGKLASGPWKAYASLQYQSASTAEALKTAGPAAFQERDAFLQAQASGSYTFTTGLQLGVYGRNLCRDFTLQGASGLERPSRAYASPREFGFTLGWNF